MDYEKAYKEALEMAKKIKHDVGNAGCAMDADMLDIVFPELVVSEDEKIKNMIAKCLACGVRDKTINDEENIKCLTWLENQKDEGKKWLTPEELERIKQLTYDRGFKDGVASIKPAEWSEEDENTLTDISHCIRYSQRDDGRKERLVRFLETHYRPTWKPSEEQMEALKYALGKGGTYNKEVLDSLSIELQKLL